MAFKAGWTLFVSAQTIVLTLRESSPSFASSLLCVSRVHTARQTGAAANKDAGPGPGLARNKMSPKAREWGTIDDASKCQNLKQVNRV